MKIKRHNAYIENIAWHLELKMMGKHLENPFNIELTDNMDIQMEYNILPKDHTLYDYIEDMVNNLAL